MSAGRTLLERETLQKVPYAALTGGSQILAPANTTGLIIVEPAATSGGPALRLTDRVADGGGGNANQQELLVVAHEGSGNAVDIFNYSASTQMALAVHNYQNVSNVVQFDQCGGSPILKLVNAQNASAAPGLSGTGNFLEVWGYYVYDTTAATAVVTNNNTVTDTTTPAAWVAEDVGKPITVAAVTTTIATVVSPTQITTASGALVNATGVTYSYAKATGRMGYLAKNLVYTVAGKSPYTFTTAAGASAALSVQQVSGTSDALQIVNVGTGHSLSITQTTAATAFLITANTAGSAGAFASQVSGRDYGATFTTAADGGTTLDVNKTTNGSGTVVVVNNAGTGSTMMFKAAGSSVLEVNAAGDLFISDSNGLKIGTAGGASGQKIGFFAATPIVQPLLATGASHTVDEVITVLQNLGLVRQS